MPTSGMTVDQLIDRYIDDRSPSWGPGAGAETRSRVAQHITHRPSPRHPSHRTQLGRDLIVRKPAAKIDRPRGTKPDINPPAPSEVIRMITAASEPLAVFLGLGALTGARRGQLCGLR
jgi:integrase